MQGLGIIILIVLFFWLCWPSISRWLKRKALQRAENYFRSRMGMPPPPPHSKDHGASYTKGRSTVHEPIIPKEYAEDVEFSETIDYSRVETHVDTKTTEKYHESQISDAEWTEIKSTRTKGDL